MNTRNRRFLIQSLKIAATSGSNFRVGALITKGNRFLGVGVNSRKTHPDSNSWCKSTHAEHRAILNAGLNDLQGSTMFVARTLKDGSPAIAKPCPSCSTLIKRAGIKKVIYTTSVYPFWEEYGV